MARINDKHNERAIESILSAGKRKDFRSDAQIEDDYIAEHDSGSYPRDWEEW